MEGDETIKQPPTGRFNPFQSKPSGDSHDGDTVVEGVGHKTPPSSPSSSSASTKTPFSNSQLPSKTPGAPRPPRAEPDTTPQEVKTAMLDESRLMNQYVLVNQVGQGGMGSVWKAWDKRLARWVAIKFLNATEEESVRRFQREAQLSARLRHPNICTIFEVNEAKGLQYLAMDFIDGTSIGKAKLSMRQMIEGVTKVCRALDYAHKMTIIHRDIKPANIMVSKEGEPFVTDFGLAKVLSAESSISVAGAVLGTPAYMPPEQATGKIQAMDSRSDIYSIGATLYTLVTGRAPFEAENATALLYQVTSTDPVAPRKVNPQVPPPIEAIILKSMEKDKRLRYVSAAEMADDLQRYLNDQPVVAKTPGLGRAIGKRLKAIVAAVVVLILVGGGAVAGVVYYPKIKGWWQKKRDVPVPTDWSKKYERLKERMAFESFKGLADQELAEDRGTIAEVPDSLADAVGLWFDKQAGDHVPAQVWPQQIWPEKKAEAKKIVDWCLTVQAVLQGNSKFASVHSRLSTAIGSFRPVVEYVPGDPHKKWRERFEEVQVRLVFSGFQPPPGDALQQMNRVVKETPEPIVGEAVGWFQRQIGENLPSQVWAKALWPDKKPEATKIVDWCAALQAVLQGARDDFGPVRERLTAAVAAFEPVARYVPETDPSRQWRDKYDDLRIRLAFSTFQGLPPEGLQQMNRVLRETPESLIDEVAGWLDSRAKENIPPLWPQQLWPDKRSEARRIVDWCDAVLAALQGANEKFKPVRDRLTAAVAAFEPVTKFTNENVVKKWKEKFDGVQLKLIFATFQAPGQEAVQEMNRILREMPESLADETAGWFERQAQENLPAQVWPKALWPGKKADARKIVDWGSAVGAVLQGTGARFKSIQDRLAAAVAAFEPVANYTDTDTVKVWVPKYEKLQEKLVFSTFRPLPETGLKELNQVLRETPEVRVDEVVRWFGAQTDEIPATLWARSLWLSKQARAREYVDWAKAARAVLDGLSGSLGAKFKPVVDRLDEAVRRFGAVLAYRGTIKLRIYCLPYAELKSLQVGDRWIVKDGKRAETDVATIVGDDLATPLVIDDLEIGDYKIELTYPSGVVPFAISGKDLKHGEKYLLSGSTDRREPPRMRKLP